MKKFLVALIPSRYWSFVWLFARENTSNPALTASWTYSSFMLKLGHALHFLDCMTGDSTFANAMSAP